jgi:internalin A
MPLRHNPDQVVETRIRMAAESEALELDLSNLQLSYLTDSIGQLSRLRMLDLSGNQLRVLPDFIGQLSQLHRLYLSGNQLSALPDFIGQLSQLETLVLNGNQLASLPESLDKLTRLETLDLDGNQLTRLPEWLGKLTSLKTLDLSGNQLTSLPVVIRELRALTRLFLHENPALGLPVEVLGPTSNEVREPERKKPSDPASILDYYFRARGGSWPLNEAKLILVGRGGAGKTCIVNRLVRNVFEDTSRTQGISITRWPLRLKGEEDVRLHIWDFGGREIMHATHQFFLTARSLYLLVLSGRQGGEDAEAEYWLQLIESFGGDSPVIVVLNKSTSTLST